MRMEEVINISTYFRVFNRTKKERVLVQMLGELKPSFLSPQGCTRVGTELMFQITSENGQAFTWPQSGNLK